MKEFSALLKSKLKDENGYFYLSGSSKMMPKQIRETMDELLGCEYVQNMINSGRYQEETW